MEYNTVYLQLNFLTKYFILHFIPYRTSKILHDMDHIGMHLP